jgi:hypothetical protein
MTERRKLDELKPGPIRHQELPPALIARIESLRSMLDEVYPQSIEAWLDGFQRDVSPESEVLWWERLAHCYLEYSLDHELNGEQKQAAFNAILKLLLGSPAEEVTPDLANLPSTALYDILEIMRRIQ